MPARVEPTRNWVQAVGLALGVAGLALCLAGLTSGCGPAEEEDVALDDEPELNTADEASSRTVMAACPNGGKTVPATPNFGAGIDGYASYVGQTGCNSTPKPGVVAFRKLVLATYPCTGDYGISRACNVGGQSEHKEGRAWDWAVHYPHPAGTALLGWLLATDDHGHKHAMARRVGIMYMIWNRRIWKSYQASAGWQNYTGSNPHTDHVHFSFSWDGANEKTSFYHAPPPPPPPPPNKPPDGNLEKVSCSGISGWARDPNAPAAAITVKLYYDKPAGATGTLASTLKADDYRADLCSKLGSCKHGFKSGIPAKFRDGKQHKIYAYALDSTNSSRTELDGSPKNFACAPATPNRPASSDAVPGSDSGPVADPAPEPEPEPEPEPGPEADPPGVSHDRRDIGGGCSVIPGAGASLPCWSLMPLVLFLFRRNRRARRPEDLAKEHRSQRREA